MKDTESTKLGPIGKTQGDVTGNRKRLHDMKIGRRRRRVGFEWVLTQNFSVGVALS